MRFLLRFLAVSCLCCAVFAQAEKSTRPNLLLIIADQWRGQALGFLGEEKVHTPNLDALAHESLVLTEAVSNYPVCSPFRGMLMSGQYPFKNKVYSNCNSKTTPYDCELQLETETWSDVLAEQGYSLGYIGKWHLEAPRKPYVKSYNNGKKMAWNEWTPPSRRHGFSFWHAYNTFDRHMKPEYWETDMKREERLKVDRWGPEHEADIAINFLGNKQKQRKADQPFALVVSMNPPHMPYQAVPKRYLKHYAKIPLDELIGDRPDLQPAKSRLGKYTRNNFRFQYAMMTGVDEQVGRILKSLTDLGLKKNTIVVFTSDHGDCIGLHGKVSKNNHYELSMRVPMIVRWPGKIEARHDDLLLSTPDLYPTLLSLMGQSSKVPKAVEGRDHSEVFESGKGERPDAQLYMWSAHDNPVEGRRGIRNHRYTLVIDRDRSGNELVTLRDRSVDPYQMKNFAKEQPALVKQLRSKVLEPLLKRIDDPWL